jgi:enoyl-CoA hydratase/3-hydroxyacyl-CoA dehydrogenase
MHDMITFKGRTIEKIAVIGSGQIGPDIALHFAKVLAPYGVTVLVLDVVDEALKTGQAKAFKKIDKGVETGAFKAPAADAMKNALKFTSTDGDVVGASLIVEAATENREVKQKIFERMEELTSHSTILASNSSHMEPEVIFEKLKDPSRSMVTHYFFPAERNPIVEVVPGAGSNPADVAWMMDLFEWMGKVPIEVKSRYGYAIDPIFEGLFQAACLCVEAGLGTTKQVDHVARETLRLGVGPFTAMNLTGGNPITVHGLDEMHGKVMPYFKSPKLLHDAVDNGTAWEVPGRGEKIEVDPDQREKIAREMKGAYFGLVTEILDSGISNIADLDMAVELALVVGAPFRMMNKTGIRESLALVEAYAANHSGFKVADALRARAEGGEPWNINVIVRKDVDGVAVLTIRRPKVLNALNHEAFTQIRSWLDEMRDDDAVKAVVITGHGKKAFISGADVGFLARIDSPEMGEQTSLQSQEAINAIEDFPKPVVAAINGLAFGGGCELAMGCHARIANAGQRVLAAQPEPNLGIIPGAGGTQRLPRLVGVEKAAELLRTGRPVSSDEAREIGLVDRLVDEDLVEAAVAHASELAAGDKNFCRITMEALSPPDKLPDVDIGHLSRAVDAVMIRAIVEGNRLPLREGLKLEAAMFGEVVKTEDMKIGVQNFLKNGPRSKADFVHR